MLLRKSLACNALVSFVERQVSPAIFKGPARLVITLKSTRRVQDHAVLAYSAALSKWHELVDAKMAFGKVFARFQADCWDRTICPGYETMLSAINAIRQKTEPCRVSLLPIISMRDFRIVCFDGTKRHR
jgi:hypothetical protein